MQTDRKSKRRSVKRMLLYLAAFFIPPALVSIVVFYNIVSGWMTVRYPSKLPVEFPEPPDYDPSKQVALVLVSNNGTESTDLLAPYEILASSGVLNVYTIAPKREISPIWHGVDIVPHFSFEEFEKKIDVAPALILIPNIADPQDSTVIRWVQRNAGDDMWMVSVCEGARVLAESGLLHNRKASSHFWALDQFEKDYPTTEWTRGVRFVEDGNIITSAGVTASIDATLQALRRVAGLEVARETARKLNYPMELHPRNVDAFDFKTTDFISLFTTAGCLWNKTETAVLLFEGISEIELGSILDLYPRVFDGTAGTVAPARKPIRSKNGLDLVPWWSFEEAPGLDQLVFFDNAFSESNAPFSEWAKTRGISVNRFNSEKGNSEKSLFAYDIIVSDIASRRSNAVARAVAKTVEYPVKHLELSGASWPVKLLLFPLALGLFSVTLVWWIKKKLAKQTKT